MFRLSYIVIKCFRTAPLSFYTLESIKQFLEFALIAVGIFFIQGNEVFRMLDSDLPEDIKQHGEIVLIGTFGVLHTSQTLGLFWLIRRHGKIVLFSTFWKE